MQKLLQELLTRLGQKEYGNIVAARCDFTQASLFYA